MLVIKVICAQSPPGRIYEDIFIFCKVVEENYYIKKGKKKWRQFFWKKYQISKWAYLGYQKIPLLYFQSHYFMENKPNWPLYTNWE